MRIINPCENCRAKEICEKRDKYEKIQYKHRDRLHALPHLRIKLKCDHFYSTVLNVDMCTYLPEYNHCSTCAFKSVCRYNKENLLTLYKNVSSDISVPYEVTCAHYVKEGKQYDWI